MKILRTRDVKMPNRGSKESAGIDIFIPNEFPATIIPPGGSVKIPAGIKADVPADHMLTLFNKSGIAAKKSLVVGACIIDEDYTGEIHINIINVGSTLQIITGGDKITQMICLPVSYVDIEEATSEEDCFGDKFEASERGSGGFGSTGDK